MEKTKYILQNPYRVARLVGCAVLISVWLVRLAWSYYLLNMRGPLGLFSIPLIGFPFLITLCFGSFIYLILFWRTYVKTKSFLPILVIIATTIIAFLLPLPPRPQTPEEIHFHKYRADYEYVVELVQNGELQDCAYPPLKYIHVSNNTCIWIDRRAGYLIIDFHPFDFYHPIVYSESGSLDYVSACNNGGFVEAKLDENWYVCQRDWN